MIGRRSEQGQAIMLFAILIPLTVLFTLGVMDYMVTNLRVMETVAAADLAAHAGAQVVRLDPGGAIIPQTAQATQVATAYFYVQAPEDAVLNSVTCGLREGRPVCSLTASVRSTGFLMPKRWVQVNALGILAYGATRKDQ